MTSSSAQLRKIKKPLIERRRRERINDSLHQLKQLVLEATQKDESRYTKMEKADILEMTVTHLRTVCRKSPTPADVASRYMAGYRQCAVEVGRYLTDAVDPSGLLSSTAAQTIRTDLLHHLTANLQTKLLPSGDEDLPPEADDRVCWSAPLSRDDRFTYFRWTSTPSETGSDVMSPSCTDTIMLDTDDGHKPEVHGSRDLTRSVTSSVVSSCALSSVDVDAQSDSGCDADVAVWRPW